MIKKLIAIILVFIISFISTPVNTPKIVEAAHTPFTWTWYNYYSNHYGVITDRVDLNGSEFLELKLPRFSLLCSMRGDNACGTQVIFLFDINDDVVETLSFQTIFPAGEFFPTYPPNDFVIQFRNYIPNINDGTIIYFRLLLGTNNSTTIGYGEFLSDMNEASSYNIYPVVNKVEYMTPTHYGGTSSVYLINYFSEIPYDPFGGAIPDDFYNEDYRFMAWYYYLPSTNTYVKYNFDRAFSTTEEAIQNGVLRLYSFYYGISYYVMYNLLEYYHSSSFYDNPTDLVIKELDSFPGNPTKEGYEFLGWYSRSGALVLAVNPTDSTQVTFSSTPLLNNKSIPQDDYAGCKQFQCPNLIYDDLTQSHIPVYINLYARYKRIVESDAFPNTVGEPNIPESFAFLLEDLGLYDPTGLMFLFVLVTLIINGLIIYYLKFDFLFILIANLILTTLFMYFNMIPLIVGIIIMAFYLLAFLMVMKGEKTTYE